MVRSLLSRKTIKAGFIKAISENFCGGDAAPVVEKELEAASVTRGVGVCDRFGIAKGVKERAKCTNLISDLRLPFGVGREPEELVYKEIGTEALAGACDPPYTRKVSGETILNLTQSSNTDTPENDGLRLVPSPHDEVNFCGQLVEMRGGRSWSTGKGHACILVASFLVILRGDFVGVCKGLVGIDYDEVRGKYPRVRIVRAETSVENGEDGVISRIYGGGCGGGYEVNEVARSDGVGGRRHRGATAAWVAVRAGGGDR